MKPTAISHKNRETNSICKAKNRIKTDKTAATMTQQQEFGWGVSWISLLLNGILKPSY